MVGGLQEQTACVRADVAISEISFPFRFLILTASLFPFYLLLGQELSLRSSFHNPFHCFKYFHCFNLSIFSFTSSAFYHPCTCHNFQRLLSRYFQVTFFFCVTLLPVLYSCSQPASLFNFR